MGERRAEERKSGRAEERKSGRESNEDRRNRDCDIH